MPRSGRNKVHNCSTPEKQDIEGLVKDTLGGENEKLL